ncbi:hypothetical protein V8F20_012578 [Naviculisporaceae sp. PSN 640]
MATPVTSPSSDEATSTPESGNSEPPPFDFIKLPDNYHHDATKDIQRLDCHIRTSDMIQRFDNAIKTLSAKVSDKWATRNLPYLRVAVLLIRWEEDDLGVDEEIKELQDLLTRFFRYAVDSWLIPKGTPKRVYIALMNKLHSFTEAHNTEDTLIWIYYGGHGRQDPRYPGPIWFPKRSGGTDNDTHVQSAHLLPILSDLDCDVLLLFDSCQAIPPNIASCGKGVVSVLSATGFDGGVAGVAPPVGPHSFTRALIDELASILNHFVSSTDAQPTTDIALHGNLLVRLKLHLSSVEKDTRGKIKCAHDGSVVFERVQRRTPFYRFLSDNKQPRPIYIAPLPAAPNHYKPGESPLKTQRGKHVLEEDSENEQDHAVNAPAGATPASASPPTEPDVPRVLVRVLLNEGQFNIDNFADWILQAPKQAIDVHIEGAYGSLSTLLIIKMPLAVWNLLPGDPALSLIGYITTDNEAGTINNDIQRRVQEGSARVGSDAGRRPSPDSPSRTPTGIESMLSEPGLLESLAEVHTAPSSCSRAEYLLDPEDSTGPPLTNSLDFTPRYATHYPHYRCENCRVERHKVPEPPKPQDSSSNLKYFYVWYCVSFRFLHVFRRIERPEPRSSLVYLVLTFVPGPRSLLNVVLG